MSGILGVEEEAVMEKRKAIEKEEVKQKEPISELRSEERRVGKECM